MNDSRLRPDSSAGLRRRREEVRRLRAVLAEDAGGALPTVLILITIVTTLTGAVMAVYLAQHRFIRRDVHRLQASYAAEAGLYEALVRLEQHPQWRVRGVTVPCAGTYECRLWTEAYGGFVRLAAEATVHGYTRRHRALAAQKPIGAFENAVALGDERSDLTLAGATRIVGPVALGRGRVTTQQLQGRPFTGHFEGETRREQSWSAYEANLPRETMQQQQAHLQYVPGDAVTLEEVRENSSTEAARGEYLRSVYAEGNTTVTSADRFLVDEHVRLLVTGNLSVQGPLRLHAGTRLVVRDTLRIAGAVEGRQNLLVAGRAAVVEGWSGGAVQVLAGRKITVRGDAHLEYPSLLYVDGWTDSSDEVQNRYGGSVRKGRIDVLDGARVDGAIFYPSASEGAPEPEEDLGTVLLAEGAEVRGALYSSARTELGGRVYGSVLTRAFYFYRSPTHYVNWIDGGVADVTRRPPDFLTPIGFGGNGALELDLIRLNDDPPRGIP